MKKIISLAIAAVMCAGLALGAGCSHSHEFGEWKVQKAATCTQEGVERRDCKECEYSQTRVIEMTPHTAATYTADGSKHWKVCTVCQQRFDEGAHTFSGSVCSVCQYDKNGTSVLQYSLNSDRSSFTVTGVQGTAPEKVTIPSRYVGFPVTRIATGAFVDQQAMKSITLPDQLEEIDSGAFDTCTVLQSLNIPASVTNIAKDAFLDCNAIASVSVEKGNKYYSAVDGILYDAPMTKFIYIPGGRTGTLEIPEKIVKIEAGVFLGGSLEKVVIGAHVTEVAAGAFRGCKSLKEIEVKSASTVIKKGAIVDCTALDKLVLATMWQDGLSEPDPGRIPTDRATGDSYIGYIFGAEYYGGTGLSVPTSLKTVEFTGGDKLRNYTFRDCASLENVILPASLQALGDEAFYGCDSLKSVSIGEGNTSYLSKDGVMYNLSKGAVTSFKFIPNALAGEVTILEGITTIASYAFDKCSVEKLNLPASLRTIQDRAFNECNELTSVSLPDTSVLTSIGNDAFYECESLRSVVIPASVTDIGERAFFNCNDLSSVVFKVTDGWEKQNGDPVSSDDLQNPAIAAELLKTSVFSWKRSV